MTFPPHPIASTRPAEVRRFVRHLGLHHFAHLRAVAEGLDIAECAARYLGTERRTRRSRSRAAAERTVASRRLARDIRAG